MTTAQVVETSVTVNKMSYSGLRAPYEMIPGFKPVTLLLLFDRLINAEQSLILQVN